MTPVGGSRLYRNQGPLPGTVSAQCRSADQVRNGDFMYGALGAGKLAVEGIVFEYTDGAGPGAQFRGIDQNQRVRILDGRQQRQAERAAVHELDIAAAAALLLQAPRHKDAGAVIAQQRIAHPENENPVSGSAWHDVARLQPLLSENADKPSAASMIPFDHKVL